MHLQLGMMRRTRIFHCQKVMTQNSIRGHDGHGKDPCCQDTVSGKDETCSGISYDSSEMASERGAGGWIRNEIRPHCCRGDRLGLRSILGLQDCSWLPTFHSNKYEQFLENKAN